MILTLCKLLSVSGYPTSCEEAILSMSSVVSRSYVLSIDFICLKTLELM